jgi:zinc transporter
VETVETTYGSDKAGLVCGYLFMPGLPGCAVTSQEAESWLHNPTDERADPIGEFLWLHFNLANNSTERWLRNHLPLPDAFFESLHQISSTRVEMIDDTLLAVINDVQFQFFASDAPEASPLIVCVHQKMLVSARITALRSVDRLRACVRGGEGFRSPAELLAHLLRDQAEVLEHIVRDAAKKVDEIEDGLLAQQVSISRPKLGSLRRMLVRLQRLLTPEPAALFRLLNRPPAWVSAEDLRDLRQSAEELAAAVADSVALVERVRLLQEELFALVNEQTNRTLFVLTIVTVLALPLTIIPGLLGMNVGGVPLREGEGGFWLVVVALIACTVGGALWAFRRRGNF